MSQENETENDPPAPIGMDEVTAPPPLPLGWTQLGPLPANTPYSHQNSDNNHNDDHDDDERVRLPPIRFPQDVMEISKTSTDTELCSVGTAGQKITHMGNDLYKYCNPDIQQLILRSHVITKMEGLKGFRNLTLLELYDNSIRVLEDLDSGEDGKPGIGLTVLDMSYNVIRDMTPVQLCPNLTELYLAQNKLNEISGLQCLTKLRKLDLGANRIRIMKEEELSPLVELEDLWLGKNKIENIGGLSKLTKLRRLDVQSNRLTVVENLTAQKDSLVELYLSHNNIGNRGASQPTGIAVKFTKLTTLDLSRNRISNTSHFAHLESLEDLWLSSNKISSFEEIEPLSVLGTRENACLEAIYLEYNPIANEFDYRQRLVSIIPSLEQIDANLINAAPIVEGKNTNLSVPSALKEISSHTGNWNLEERMREQQDKAIERAKKELKENDDNGNIGLSGKNLEG